MEELQGALAGVLGGLDQVAETDDRDQRGGLDQHLPVVADARQGVAQHLRQEYPAEHSPAPHAVGLRGFDLAGRDRLEGAAEGFREVGAIDERQGDAAGGERVDVDLADAEGVGDAVEEDLQAEEQQQHDDQVGDAADQRCIAAGQGAQRAVGGELGAGAEEADEHGAEQGAQRQFQGHQGAGEYLRAEAVEEHFTLHCLLLSVEVKSGRTPFRACRRGRSRSSGH